MNLKELIALDNEELKGKSFYGIEVTEYTTETIKDLSEVGFTIQYNDSGDYVSDDLIDVILEYKNTDVSVVLEVPFSENSNIDVIHHFSRSTQIDLSLLPPTGEVKTEQSLAIYNEQLQKATVLWLEQTGASYMLYPSSGYFHYMIRSYFDGKPDTISNDEYMIKNYVETLSEEEMDILKANLHGVFIEHIGGEEAFAVYANSIASGLVDTVEQMSEDVIAYYKELDEEEAKKSEESSEKD